MLQCDESRPSCTQCVKSKRTCPGYAQALDLVLRDQTRITQDKIEGKKAQRSKTDPPTESSHKSPKTFRAPRPPNCAAKVLPSPLLLPELSPSSREDVAVSMFFSQIISVPRHPETIRGFLECLLPLYTATLDGSLLHQAVASVSLAILGGSPVHLQERLLARRNFGKALKATHRAINDPQESVKDETLMAVLLLGLYEVRQASQITLSCGVRCR